MVIEEFDDKNYWKSKGKVISQRSNQLMAQFPVIFSHIIKLAKGKSSRQSINSFINDTARSS